MELCLDQVHPHHALGLELMVEGPPTTKSMARKISED